jgi:hypothetical protein
VALDRYKTGLLLITDFLKYCNIENIKFGVISLSLFDDGNSGGRLSLYVYVYIDRCMFMSVFSSYTFNYVEVHICVKIIRLSLFDNGDSGGRLCVYIYIYV